MAITAADLLAPGVVLLASVDRTPLVVAAIGEATRPGCIAVTYTNGFETEIRADRVFRAETGYVDLDAEAAALVGGE